jgi:hypothetical protein
MSNSQQSEALLLAEKLRDMCSQFNTPSHERGVINGAIQELRRQHARIAGLEAARIAYASEFEPNADGDPDVDNIHANIRALKAQPACTQASATVSDEQIKAVFLANGFTIKEGLTDLKPYVYKAARALLAAHAAQA